MVDITVLDILCHPDRFIWRDLSLIYESKCLCIPNRSRLIDWHCKGCRIEVCIVPIAISSSFGWFFERNESQIMGFSWTAKSEVESCLERVGYLLVIQSCWQKKTGCCRLLWMNVVIFWRLKVNLSKNKVMVFEMKFWDGWKVQGREQKRGE